MANAPMLQAFPINNNYAPKKQPLTIPIIVTLASGVPQAIDLQKEIGADTIDFFQTVYIDNYDNASEVTLVSVVTGQRLKCAARNASLFPLLASGGGQFTISAAFNGNVRLQFLNIPMAPFWGAGDAGANAVAPLFRSFADVALTNGAATLIMAAFGSRVNALIVPLSTNTVSIRIGDSGVSATDGLELQPGQAITLATTDEIWAFAGAAAQSVSRAATRV